MTREEAETKAREDHAAVVGRLIRVRNLTAYPEDGGDPEDICCDPPALCRVQPSKYQELKHWCYEWLDPYWDLDLVEPHPQLEGYDSFYMFGPSYNMETGERTDDADWELGEG